MILVLSAGKLEDHQQEHVGAGLKGELAFFESDREVVLRAGDLYRMPAHVPHRVRGRSRAVVAQVREDVWRPDGGEQQRG